MPEIPEYHIAAQQINTWCDGKFFVLVEKSEISKQAPIQLDYSSFSIRAAARGKELCLFLKRESKEDTKSEEVTSLTFNMGMSGEWKWTTAQELPKHSHLRFHSEDGWILNFVDTRRYGKWRLGTFNEERGPDPILVHFESKFFLLIYKEFEQFTSNISANFHKREFEKPICEMLMNQKFFNGIGNYLRAEILDRAGVVPFVSSREALKSSVEKLKKRRGSKMAKEILASNDILALCKTLPEEAIDLTLKKASYDSHMLVYGKVKTKIQDINGRTLYYQGELGPLTPEVRRAKRKKKVKEKKEEENEDKDTLVTSKKKKQKITTTTEKKKKTKQIDQEIQMKKKKKTTKKQPLLRRKKPVIEKQG